MLFCKRIKASKYVKKLEGLNENIKVNVYHIRAKDLKKITGLKIAELDEIIDSISDMPIKKYRQGNETYYLFPMELIISNYILTSATSLKVQDLTQATKSY